MLTTMALRSERECPTVACQAVVPMDEVRGLVQHEDEQEKVALLLVAARLLLLKAAAVLLMMLLRWAVMAAAELLLLLLSCYHCRESPLALSKYQAV